MSKMAEQCTNGKPQDEIKEKFEHQSSNTVQKVSLKWIIPFVGLKERVNLDFNVVFVEKPTNNSKIRNRELTAHKEVLSITSPFFFKMFQGNWREKDQEKLPVPGGFQWEVFEAVIAFLYGEDVEIEEDRLPELYRAADYLEVDLIKRAIADELLRNDSFVSDPTVVFKLCDVGGVLTDPVYSAAITYIVRHIAVILAGDVDMSSLPLDTVAEVAQSEEVSVPELTLLHFLNKWTSSNQDDVPQASIQDLFGYIRYGTFTHSQLTSEVATCKFYNREKFEEMLHYDGDMRSNCVQFCHRRGQKPTLLFYCPVKKHIVHQVTATLEGVSTVYPGYSKIRFNIQWEKPAHSMLEQPQIIIDISSCVSDEREKNYSSESVYIGIPCKNQSFGPSRCGISFTSYEPTAYSCEMELTPDEIVARFEGGQGIQTRSFNRPFPCLIVIRGCIFLSTLTIEAYQ